MIPNARLTTTALIDASTPAAPLIPQNHGVGLTSMDETKRIPVGKPKPNEIPPGAISATQSTILTASVLSLKAANAGPMQNVKATV